MNWIPVQFEAPPYNVIVETKTGDTEQQLIYSKGQWFNLDGKEVKSPEYWRMTNGETNK